MAQELEPQEIIDSVNKLNDLNQQNMDLIKFGNPNSNTRRIILSLKSRIFLKAILGRDQGEPL
jgi:hypothetical protein